jgi:hypothetical protein
MKARIDVHADDGPLASTPKAPAVHRGIQDALRRRMGIKNQASTLIDHSLHHPKLKA